MTIRIIPKMPQSAKRRFASPATLLLLTISLLFFGIAPVLAANPPPQEVFFIPLPDDWLMQHMEDLDANGGTVGDAYPPVRAVIGISIAADGTLIYWDQWEHASGGGTGYDADIANPADVYSTGNPGGTQIWGDGNVANGCPPRFRDLTNPCTQASHDQLKAGDVIVLDNLVPITSSGGGTPNHGPWLNGRSASVVRFDGKDKFGATYPVAVARAGWSEGANGSFPAAGSLLSDATAIEATVNWGTSFIVPVGTNTTGFTSGNEMNYAHVTVQASQNATTVCVDVPPLNPANCTGAGDSSSTINAGQQYDPTAMPNTASPQGVPHGTAVRSDKPVQVILVTGDVNSTWATRWYNLEPRDQWNSSYYAPVGTSGTATAVWVYNPNGSAITVYYDEPGTANDSSQSCAANTACKMPNIPASNGVRYYTTGATPPIFYPVSVTDYTGAQIYDWGYGLLPLDRLTTQVLVGWAPGCTTFSGPNECFDQTTPSDGTQGRSRTPVWVMPVANTTVYVDLNGSGINCPNGLGSEYSFAASALTSYPLVDDPAEIVRDEFSTQAYNNNDSPTGENWNSNWTETNDDGSASSGDILVNSTNDYLEFNAGVATNDSIQRTEGTTGATKAVLTFFLGSSGNLEDDDDLAVEVSTSASGSWTVLEQFNNDPSPNPTAKTYDISDFISANTTIRFRVVEALETDEYWYVDNVTIDRGTGQVDFDMSGTRLRTCDGTQIVTAWGQQPSLSYSGDDEALDMGTTLFPLGSQLVLEKRADRTEVAVGGPVIYSYDVWNTGLVQAQVLNVTDDKCAPAVFSSGDTDSDGYLDPGETWIFTCTSNVFVDTTNVAYATSEVPPWTSAPDEWTVTVIPPTVIGNYVWLDEDGDSDQDAGEAGIPNVKVDLCADGACTTILQTTYTDANGGYLFDGLAPGTYWVRTTPPAGLNQTYDENGVGTPNITQVTVAAGDEHMSADFGYNWAPALDTNNPPLNATAAIGDRVWIDANGDGIQDPGEAGLGGVTVTLYSDPDGNGVYDTVAGTTATDAAGNYIFDGLAPAAYVVKATRPANYTQTGDPDGTLDNQTTDPIVLGPGDVYVNADFGYQPSSSSSTIGDYVWLDANADSVQDGNEGGIPGVTVALFRDDGDGVYEPGIDKVIATDITDENGLYLFPGLPAGTYFVEVTDTENVLGELAPTYDANGGNDERSRVTVDGTNSDTDQDFGYAPPGHNAGEGLIGDTIWLDRDGDGFPGAGEGLEGVRVTLTDPGPDGVLGNTDDTSYDTYTNENGNYYFGGLDPTLSYRITVDTLTLPTGVTNTKDPDGTTDSTTVRNLSVTGPADLGADFAYRDQSDPNTIGGTLWVDTNADGTLTEAGRFEGVTVVLRDSKGNIVATTTTDSNGDYSFAGLPDGTYTVDVTDDANILNGYWHSLGLTPGAPDNSQLDPYTVTVGPANRVDTTGDFGYYIEPAALGDFVWEDVDHDGVQDTGELVLGLPGVLVKLTITYPNANSHDTLHRHRRIRRLQLREPAVG